LADEDGKKVGLTSATLRRREPERFQRG